MALRLEDKKALVAEVAEVANGAYSALVAEYRGLTVEQLTQFRQSARKSNIWVRVVKNTLAKRALTGTEFECLNQALTGPLLLAFSREDPGAAARLAKEFAKKNEQFVVKALAIDGQYLPGSDIARLANLPTREEALAMLCRVMQAPITKLVRTLAEPQAKLVRLMAAVREQKQAAA